MQPPQRFVDESRTPHRATAALVVPTLMDLVCVE